MEQIFERSLEPIAPLEPSPEEPNPEEFGSDVIVIRPPANIVAPGRDRVSESGLRRSE